MNRIDQTFKRLKKEKKKAFIPYVAAGDPDMKTSKHIIEKLIESGADIVEIGIPFSDPLADGPTIQKAVKRSLEAGCTVKKVLTLAKELRREINTPLVFMTYYNIVFNYGLKKFIKDAKAVGVDGIIVPDLPMEESDELLKIVKNEKFHLIMLTAPTTPLNRFKKIASRSGGFVYHVSLTGVTGARKVLAERLKSDIKLFKKMTPKPVCVGFGISSPGQAKDIARVADGVICGSAIIKLIEKNLSNKSSLIKKVGNFSKSIAKAIHGASKK